MTLFLHSIYEINFQILFRILIIIYQKGKVKTRPTQKTTKNLASQKSENRHFAFSLCWLNC